MNSSSIWKILVIFPGRLGDALMCTPPLKVLAEFYPDASIDALAESSLGAVVSSHNPRISRVFSAPSKEMLKQLARDYQLAVNLHCVVNHELGYLRELESANPNLRLIYPEDQIKTIHRSESNIRSLVNQLKPSLDPVNVPYEFEVLEKDRSALHKRLQANGVDIDHQRLLVFQLGCHGIQKNAKPWKFWKKISHERIWNWERFLALERLLRESLSDITIVLPGAGKERLLVNNYKEKSAHAVSTLDLDIGELAALLENCDCLVTPDTGTMHLGCAVGTPMVALFGPTSSVNTGPYPLGDKIRILHEATLDDIAVESVYDSVRDLLTA